MANVDDLYKKSFGQLGSLFLDASGAASPPSNRVFIAITFLDQCVFDASGGLVADTSNSSLEFIGNTAAHDASDGSETTISGSGGVVIDASNTFPKGVTIFGRWTEIDLTSGMLVAYIGE